MAAIWVLYSGFRRSTYKLPTCKGLRASERASDPDPLIYGLDYSCGVGDRT